MIGPIEILLWMLAAVMKFVLTPSLMIGRGVGYGVTIATCSIGAALGVYVFFHFGKLIFAKWGGNRRKRGKKPRVFTTGKRRWVRFQTRFGLLGLLIVSGLISVPISAILAAKYHKNDVRMPWLLMCAFAVWTVVLTSMSIVLSGSLTE